MTRSAIDRYDREQARKDLRGLLDNSRNLMTKVREISDILLDEAPGGIRTVLGLALYGIRAAIPTVRVLRGPGFRWYREALGLTFPDPLDALVEFNALEVKQTPQALAQVDEVLCAAFLADLRDAFTKGLRARQRTGNGVALIDNADSPAGQAFLEVLVTLRWPRAAAVPHAAAFAHRLTHGHLWSVCLVLRAVATAVERVGAQAVDLRGVLDWPDPDHPDRTLGDGAIDRLLRGTPSELRQALITCSTASDLSSPSRLQTLGREAGKLNGFCSTDLCGSALHPFLRRVLLHALAGRAANDPDRWQAVHRRLRSCDEDEDHDSTQTMYHTLALGELAPVAAHLDARFAAADKVSWSAELHTIAAAPRLAGPAVQTPREHVEELTSVAVADLEPLARLVAALWIGADPLGDPGRTLDLGIAADLELLARRAGSNRDVLLGEANRYRTRGCAAHRRLRAGRGALRARVHRRDRRRLRVHA